MFVSYNSNVICCILMRQNEQRHQDGQELYSTKVHFVVTPRDQEAVDTTVVRRQPHVVTPSDSGSPEFKTHAH